MDIVKAIKELEKQGFIEAGDQTDGSSDWDKMWNWEENKIFEGVFIEKREGIGENNSNVYTVEAKDGLRYGIWGSYVLDGRLKNVAVGEKIVILYLGKRASKKRKGKEYRDFKVFHKGGTADIGADSGTDGGIVIEDIPLPNEEDKPISNKDFSEEKG